MSGYLIDTNVISLLAPARGLASPAFLSWLEQVDGEGGLFLPVVAIHEIEKGIALLEHKGAHAKAKELTLWLSGLVDSYGDKILAIDTATAAVAGRLEARAIAAGHNPGMADATIAAIAQANDLVIVTVNTRHFRPFGVAATTPKDVAASG